MKKSSKLLVIMTLAAASFFVAKADTVSMNLTYDGTEHNYNAGAINLFVNGAKIDFSQMPPIVLNGSVYIPAREVFEPLGAVIDWKANAKELYIGHNGNLTILKTYAPAAEVNGVWINLENPAKIINEKLMVPVRFVAESMSIPIEWDGDSRTVYVGQTLPPEEAQAPPDTSSETPADNGLAPIPVENPVFVTPVDLAGLGEITNAPLSEDISTETISAIDSAIVKVTSVTQEGNTISISADGAISKIEKLLLEPENKFVVDIHNSTNALSQNSYTFPGFQGVTAVRNSQFATTPVRITRVVLDLNGANRFSVSISPDRKTVYVKFEENTVRDIIFESGENADTMTIKCTNSPNVKPMRLFSPDRIAFDIISAQNGAAFAEKLVEGGFVSGIRVAQFDPSTVRVVADLKSDAQYSVSTDGTDAVIQFSAPTYRNIVYNEMPASTLTLLGLGVSPSQIIHEDRYLQGEYSFVLPGDYSAILGSGTYGIYNGVFNSVTIGTRDGNTEIIISQNGILAYNITEQNGSLVISPINPRDKYKAVVYIDAGHGGNDPGAVAGGFYEKNLNLNILMRLNELLAADDSIKAYASRLDDTYPQNIQRARIANEVADLFVSVHHNSGGSKSNGTEVLYYNHANENPNGMNSQAAAKIFQNKLSGGLGTTDRGIVTRPDLIVLNQTTIPAVLTEILFMTYDSDLQKVATPEGRQLAAQLLYEAIKECFETYPTGR